MGGYRYQIKMWVDTHTCVRVFNNKYAKSKWVEKVMENKWSVGLMCYTIKVFNYSMCYAIKVWDLIMLLVILKFLVMLLKF